MALGLSEICTLELEPIPVGGAEDPEGRGEPETLGGGTRGEVGYPVSPEMPLIGDVAGMYSSIGEGVPLIPCSPSNPTASEVRPLAPTTGVARTASEVKPLAPTTGVKTTAGEVKPLAAATGVEKTAREVSPLAPTTGDGMTAREVTPLAPAIGVKTVAAG